MYARRSGERELTFDFGGGLKDDNLLIVDRETHSVWSQLEGKAIEGPLAGAPLRVLPSLQTTWGFWRRRHPETRVMVVAEEEGRPYHYRSWQPGEPRPEAPPSGHDTSRLGLGLALGQDALFLPFRELDRIEPAAFPLALEVDGRPVRVHYAREAMTAWAEDGDGNLLEAVLAYEWGWQRFHPETRRFRAP